jgi:hypothetical protein
MLATWTVVWSLLIQTKKQFLFLDNFADVTNFIKLQPKFLEPNITPKPHVIRTAAITQRRVELQFALKTSLLS